MRWSLVFAFGLAACKTGDSKAPTWHQDVAPVISQHCTGCHVAGGIAPFALDSYEAAAPMAPAVAAAIESGEMPPWFAKETADCQPRKPWADDLRLSDDEIAMIRAWADAGAPEGDEKNAATLIPPPQISLDADTTLAPIAPYTVDGDQDQFTCFTLDPQLTETMWITGAQIEPGNPKVVHHVLVFDDPEGQSATLADANGRWDCSQDLGVSDLSLVSAWAPGDIPMRTPPDVGMPITPGHRLFMQIHYHPTGTGAADPDSTKVALQWTSSRPSKQTVLMLIGNSSSTNDGLDPDPDDRGTAEFRIPADIPDHIESMTYPIDDTGSYPIWVVGTHMHMIGTDMRITLHHGEPTTDEPADECLIETPGWDFNWQRGYAYNAPIDELPKLHHGDTLHLTCTYDNTMDNPGTRTALAQKGLDAPTDVYLGETTLDEMCLGVFGFIY